MLQSRLLLVGLLLFTLVGCQHESTTGGTTADGNQTAAADIADGKLILREQPLPSPPWWNRYSTLLRDRCGVEIEVIKHSNARFTDEDIAYNKVMTAEIERQFGKGILGKLQQEAINAQPSSPSPTTPSPSSSGS